MLLALEVTTSQHCAWRAVYLATLHGETPAGTYARHLYRRQFAHIGFDPNDGGKSSIFGGVAFGRWFKSFRIAVPFSRYTHNSWHAGRMWRAWLHSLDGRFLKSN